MSSTLSTTCATSRIRTAPCTALTPPCIPVEAVAAVDAEDAVAAVDPAAAGEPAEEATVPPPVPVAAAEPEPAPPFVLLVVSLVYALAPAAGNPELAAAALTGPRSVAIISGA